MASSLLNRIARRENLFAAWNQVNKNPHSFGIDNEKIQSFRDDTFKKICEINSKLRSNKYEFSPLRAHRLITKTKKSRLLKISTVRDRIVQKAILNIVGKKFYPDFCDCSYGYIEKRRIEDAVKKIIEHIQSGRLFVLEADIIQFFDTVDKAKLLEIVTKKFGKDKSINPLIKCCLDAEIGNPEVLSCQEIEFFNNHEIGIPQGGVLSPLFANIYLTGFDKQMLSYGFQLVRYADDFIVLCKAEDEASRAYELCKTILEGQLGLKLHPLAKVPNSKTRIIDLKNEGFKYLGLYFELHENYPYKTSVEKFKTKVRELTNYNTTNAMLDNMIRLSKVIGGWGSAYKFCKGQTTVKIFSALDIYIEKRLQEMLRQLHFLSSPNLTIEQLRHLKIPKLTHL
ncbi:MAG: reverse transcriptase domain-containing protein [Candidatus Omnitrophica bacterium]|nr:reverse transcriptase domain-containing protein [Candidatus Omnitrophota bacterium]